MTLKKIFHLLLLVTIGIVLEIKSGNAAPPEGNILVIKFRGKDIIVKEETPTYTLNYVKHVQEQLKLKKTYMLEVINNYPLVSKSLEGELKKWKEIHEKFEKIVEYTVGSTLGLVPRQDIIPQEEFVKLAVEVNNVFASVIPKFLTEIREQDESEIRNIGLTLDRVKKTESDQRAQEAPVQGLEKVRRDEAYGVLNGLEQKVRTAVQDVKDRHRQQLQLFIDEHVEKVKWYKYYFNTFMTVAFEIQRRRKEEKNPIEQQQRSSNRGQQVGPQQVGSSSNKIIKFRDQILILHEETPTTNIDQYDNIMFRLHEQAKVMQEYILAVQGYYPTIVKYLVAEIKQFDEETVKLAAVIRESNLPNLSPAQVALKKQMLIQRSVELNNIRVRIILKYPEAIRKIDEEDIQERETTLNKIRHMESVQRREEPPARSQDAKLKRDDDYRVLDETDKKIREVMQDVLKRHKQQLQLNIDEHAEKLKLYKNYFSYFHKKVFEIQKRRADEENQFNQQRGRGQFGSQGASSSGIGGFKRNNG